MHAARRYSRYAASSRCGFTLVEVLVALAVLAIGVAALVTGVSGYTDNAVTLRDRALARWVAENQLTELQLAAGWPDTGSRDGRERMGGVEWRWEIEVQKTPEPNMRRASVMVRREPNGQVLARLEGFVGNPRVSGGQ